MKIESVGRSVFVQPTKMMNKFFSFFWYEQKQKPKNGNKRRTNDTRNPQGTDRNSKKDSKDDPQKVEFKVFPKQKDWILHQQCNAHEKSHEQQVCECF